MDLRHIGCLRISWLASTGVAQWIECQPVNQMVASSIPSQGIGLGCRPGPQLGARERQPIDVFLTYRCFSPSLSPASPFLQK